MYTYKIKKILKIYDGDTITIEVDLGFGVTKKEKLRLAFIDAPEIRGESRPEGLKSRDWLREVLYSAEKEDKIIIARTIRDRKGKYGRYIAELFLDDTEGISINQRMINEGYALVY